jgi:hypothetical protein
MRAGRRYAWGKRVLNIRYLKENIFCFCGLVVSNFFTVVNKVRNEISLKEHGESTIVVSITHDQHLC